MKRTFWKNDNTPDIKILMVSTMVEKITIHFISDN